MVRMDTFSLFFTGKPSTFHPKYAVDDSSFEDIIYQIKDVPFYFHFTESFFLNALGPYFLTGTQPEKDRKWDSVAFYSSGTL
jgi:hypothetical protein